MEQDLLGGVGAGGSDQCTCQGWKPYIADVARGNFGARVQPSTYKTDLVSSKCLIAYFIRVETQLQHVHLKKSCECVLP